MAKVLIVDDSATARLALRIAVERDGVHVVIGEASTGKQAIQAVTRLRPDIVLVDVYLADETGIDVAADIMATCATPILVVTSVDPHNPQLAYRSLEAGALDIRPKLPAPSHPDYETERKRLVRIIEALSSIPVVTRRRAPRPSAAGAQHELVQRAASTAGRLQPPALLLIGGSTGAPVVVRSLLEALPRPFPIPIAIAQHVAEGFALSLATWLSQATGHDVRICDTIQRLRPGVVYLAPDACHLVPLPEGCIGPQRNTEGLLAVPSIDLLFQRAAVTHGATAIGVLLTGMGADGSQGMLELRVAGAATIAQQPETCVVDSMPRKAIELGAAHRVLPPDAIADELLRLVSAEEGPRDASPSV